MEINIRMANESDMPDVHRLISELAIFEKEPNAVEISRDDLKRDGFSENPAFHCFVAEVENHVEGIALVYQRYSTWKGKTLHLEDLIVSQHLRDKGIGTALLDAVVKYGHVLGVKRISWEVLDWNTSAIEFYERKGAEIKRNWDVVHLNQQAIKNYISKL